MYCVAVHVQRFMTCAVPVAVQLDLGFRGSVLEVSDVAMPLGCAVSGLIRRFVFVKSLRQDYELENMRLKRGAI